MTCYAAKIKRALKEPILFWERGTNEQDELIVAAALLSGGDEGPCLIKGAPGHNASDYLMVFPDPV